MIQKELPFAEMSEDLKTILEYWCGLGGEQLACSWQDFHLDELPPRILPTTLVVDVNDDLSKNVFRFWGTGMNDIHGGDFTGRTTAELSPPELAAAVLATHEMTVRTRRPSASIFGFERHGGFDHMQELLRMPLSNNGDRVDNIVIAIHLTEGGRAMVEKQKWARSR